MSVNRHSSSAAALRELAEVCRRWGVESSLCDAARRVSDQLEPDAALAGSHRPAPGRPMAGEGSASPHPVAVATAS